MNYFLPHIGELNFKGGGRPDRIEADARPLNHKENKRNMRGKHKGN